MGPLMNCQGAGDRKRFTTTGVIADIRLCDGLVLSNEKRTGMVVTHFLEYAFACVVLTLPPLRSFARIRCTGTADVPYDSICDP